MAIILCNCFCVFGFAGATTYVFWDFRDCPIPDGLDAFELSLNITRVLRNMGYYGWITFRAYGDIFSLDYSEGFELFHVPAGEFL